MIDFLKQNNTVCKSEVMNLSMLHILTQSSENPRLNYILNEIRTNARFHEILMLLKASRWEQRKKWERIYERGTIDSSS